MPRLRILLLSAATLTFINIPVVAYAQYYPPPPSYGYSPPPCQVVTPGPFHGAARGAAGGALIGAISGNAGPRRCNRSRLRRPPRSRTTGFGPQCGRLLLKSPPMDRGQQ
jgi:hypothetical protein